MGGRTRGAKPSPPPASVHTVYHLHLFTLSWLHLMLQSRVESFPQCQYEPPRLKYLLLGLYRKGWMTLNLNNFPCLSFFSSPFFGLKKGGLFSHRIPHFLVSPLRSQVEASRACLQRCSLSSPNTQNSPQPVPHEA